MDKIPTIKPRESQLGSGGTTDRNSSLPGLPWSSKRAGGDPGFDFPDDLIEPLDNDDKILAATGGTKGDPVTDRILEELLNATGQGQCDGLNAGSTVALNDLSPPSLVNISMDDSESDRSEGVEFSQGCWRVSTGYRYGPTRL